MADPAGDDAVKEEIAALKAQLGDLLRRTREAAGSGELADALAERGRATAEAADAYVRRAPLPSAALAFLAGCLVGRLLR
jgi:ElaB/YqjD/DUF883 family membrane-anchored ribosome-binding protein